MKPFALLLTAALLASSAAAVAQAPAPPLTDLRLPPQYEVEVLVFANLAFDPSEERFDQSLNGFAGEEAALREVPVFDDTNFGPLASQPEPPPLVDPLEQQRALALSIRPLLPSELKLGTEYRKLQALAAYRPLVHVGWVQPGLAELVLAPRYHLKATRSARSGELHYFDHPAFGALVRVTPVPAQNEPQGRRPTP